MTVGDSGIKFIFRELDVDTKFQPAGDGYKGGIKARDLDSMNCVLRFFAKIFGHTMEYKGKLYVVGEKSFKNFSLRHRFGGEKNHFNVDLAEKQILKKYIDIYSKAAHRTMQVRSELAPKPTIHKEAGVIEISKKDLEQVFNALAVPLDKREFIKKEFQEGPQGYVITRDEFLKELEKIEHVLPQNPPASLPAELKEISKKVLEFLHHKTDLPHVEEDIDDIIFHERDTPPKPTDVHPKPAPKPTDTLPKPHIPSDVPAPKVPGGDGKAIPKPDSALVLRKPSVTIFTLNLQGKLDRQPVNFSGLPKIKVPFDLEGLKNFFVRPQEKRLALALDAPKNDALEIVPAFREIQKSQQSQVTQSPQALKVIASHLIVGGREATQSVFNKLTLCDKAQVISLACSHLVRSNSESLRNDVEFAIGQLVSHFVTANALGGHQEDVTNFLAILSQIGDMEFKYGDETIVLRDEFFNRLTSYIEGQKDLLGLPQGESQGNEISVSENQDQLLALSLLLAAQEFGLDATSLEARLNAAITAPGEKGERQIELRGLVNHVKRQEENALANIKEFLDECEGETVAERLMELSENVKESDLVIAFQKEPSLRDKMLVVLSGRKDLSPSAMMKLLEEASYQVDDVGLQEELFLLLPPIVEPNRLMAPTVVKAIGWVSITDKAPTTEFKLPNFRELSSLDRPYGQARRLIGAHHWAKQVHAKPLSSGEAKALLKEIFNGDDPSKLKAFYAAPANDIKDAAKLPIPLRKNWGEGALTATEMKEFLVELAKAAEISTDDWKLPEGGKSRKEVEKPAAIVREVEVEKVTLPNMRELTHRVPIMEQGRRLVGVHHWMTQVHKKSLSKDDAKMLLKEIFSGDDVSKLKEFYGTPANSLKNAGSLPLPLQANWGRESLTATELKNFLKFLAEKAGISTDDWKLPEGGKGKKDIEKPAAKPAEVELPDLKGLSPFDSAHGQARRLVGAYHWVKKISKEPLSREQAKGLLEKIFNSNDMGKAKAFYAAPANTMKDGGSLPKPMRAQWGDQALTATEMKAFLKELAKIAQIPSDDWQLPVGGKSK